MLSAQCDISFRSSVCFYFRTLFQTMSGPLLPDFQTSRLTSGTTSGSSYSLPDYFQIGCRTSGFASGLCFRPLPDPLPDFRTCIRIRFRTSRFAFRTSGRASRSASGLLGLLPDQLPDPLPDQLPALLPDPRSKSGSLEAVRKQSGSDPEVGPDAFLSKVGKTLTAISP